MKAFANYHPFVLISYFAAILLFSMFLNNPILQAEALLGGALFCWMLRKKDGLAGEIGFYTALFVMTAVTNPLFSHNGVTPLFFLNGNAVTAEAFAYGAAIAAALIAVLLWCKGYHAIMTSDKILCLFGNILPGLSLLLSIALRFLPMFRRQMQKVSEAQKAMGLYSSDSYFDRIRSRMRVFLTMISWSLENGMQLSASMRARGYGQKRRSQFSLFRFRAGDAVLLAMCAVLTATVAAGAAMGAAMFYYYPRISKINISPAAAAVYGAFGLLSFLPFLTEVREALVWKYYVSKI